MGSVKDLKVLTPAKESQSGEGLFTFSDRYSVFDWGQMPDSIPDKGMALSIIGAYFFEYIQKTGLNTHYLGLLEDGVPKRLDSLKNPSNRMKVKLLNVVKPVFYKGKYDYESYRRGMRNYLVPLELIYRNMLPEGSSVFKRLSEKSVQLSDLGLKEMPKPGQRFDDPILDVSTKLEPSDRYLNWAEAQYISGLDDSQMLEMKKILGAINELITKRVGQMGLVNEDGKFEFGIDEQGNFMVVDVFGTPDECRFTYQGIPVSKEIARIWYRESVWYHKVEEAKKKDKLDWKKLVEISPPKLPPRLRTLISSAYKAFCNELTGREWFPVDPLRMILKELKNETGSIR